MVADDVTPLSVIPSWETRSVTGELREDDMAERNHKRPSVNVSDVGVVTSTIGVKVGKRRYTQSARNYDKHSGIGQRGTIYGL